MRYSLHIRSDRFADARLFMDHAYNRLHSLCTRHVEAQPPDTKYAKSIHNGTHPSPLAYCALSTHARRHEPLSLFLPMCEAQLHMQKHPPP